MVYGLAKKKTRVLLPNSAAWLGMSAVQYGVVAQ